MIFINSNEIIHNTLFEFYKKEYKYIIYINKWNVQKYFFIQHTKD